MLGDILRLILRSKNTRYSAMSLSFVEIYSSDILRYRRAVRRSFAIHNAQFSIHNFAGALILRSSLFFLHLLIFLPFFDHYFRVVQRKKNHLFSSKTTRAMPKIVRLPRLRPSHGMVRPYQQRKRALVTLWLKPCRHTVWYSIAGGKMGETKGIFEKKLIVSRLQAFSIFAYFRRRQTYF